MMKERRNYRTILAIGMIAAIIGALALLGEGGSSHAQGVACHYDARATGYEELGMRPNGPTHVPAERTTEFRSLGPYEGQLVMQAGPTTALSATQPVACNDAGNTLTLSKGSGALSIFAKNCSANEGPLVFSVTMPDECRRNANPPGSTTWEMNTGPIVQAPNAATQQNNCQCACPAETTVSADDTSQRVVDTSTDRASEATSTSTDYDSLDARISCRREVEKTVTLDFNAEFIEPNADFDASSPIPQFKRVSGGVPGHNVQWHGLSDAQVSAFSELRHESWVDHNDRMRANLYDPAPNYGRVEIDGLSWALSRGGEWSDDDKTIGVTGGSWLTTGAGINAWRYGKYTINVETSRFEEITTPSTSLTPISGGAIKVSVTGAGAICYQVQYREQGASEWLDSAERPVAVGNRWETTLSGLTAGTTYQFRVRAMSLTDRSVWGPTKTATAIN